MKVPVSWLREFVDVTATPDEIAAAMSLRGFAVESIERVGDDAVIDFEVTANRPDCLSVIGFAREMATLYDLPFKPLSAAPGDGAALAAIATGESERVKVTIEDAELCPRYAAAVAEVAPAVSPAWMKDRLQAAGIRPISPLVDITNYVLVELGHPMHAFDLAMLANGEIRIRRARDKETMTTLDGIRRTLDAEMLVIADGRRAQAIGGVMGGADSEVTGATRTVVFESAYFKPASVRRTSKRLGLKTEASSRFERGADINAPVVAIRRAVALMQQVGAGGLTGAVVDRFPAPRALKTLQLRRERLERLLGMSVPDADVERILKGLGLSVTPTTAGWDVVPPTFRVDLLREVDLIEEVGRHYGFDKLEPAFPAMTMAAPAPDERLAREHTARRVLTAAGLTEAVTFGITESVAVAAFRELDSAVVAVANPLSAKFDTLRPMLLPGLVDAVAHNRRHGRRDVALFELGSRFTSDGETRGVALAWTGGAATEHWSSPVREVDFFDVKGVVERLCEALGAEVRIERGTAPYLVDGQTATALAGDRPIGVIGLIAPHVVESRGAPRQDKVFAAELNLDEIAASMRTRGDHVRPLPRYPSVVRDLSLVVSNSLPAEIIRGTIHAAAGRAGADRAPLASMTFFDRYQGKGVAEGSVSLSVRLTFQAEDRTLTDAEVQHTFDTILEALVREHGAVQR